jgi:uncharacterized protein YdaT
MIWSNGSCPAQFQFLSPRVREKAIAIGNSLLQNNVPPAHAERIAYDRAVDWARNGRKSLPEHHVVPYRGSWAIMFGSSKQPAYIFPSQDAALRKARDLACGHMTDVVLHGLDGSIINRSSFA